jgi:isoleucyl-tRNA synthetase
MLVKNPKKGVSNIKTLHTVTKSSVKQKDTADFIQLYMLEKEKQRLMSEEKKILFRLDYVQNRLRNIQNIYEHSSYLLYDQNADHKNNNRDIDSSPGFTTIQIEY